MNRTATLLSMRAGALFVLAGALLLAGCKKSDNTSTGPTSTATSEGDAGNVVAGALSGGGATGGMAAQVSDAASIAMGLGIPPSPSLGKTVIDTLPHDTTVIRQFFGLVRQYSYSCAYNWQFSPGFNQLDFGFTLTGGYSTPVISGRDSAFADYTITSIGGPDTMLTFKGTYTRLGVQSLKSKDSTNIYSKTDIGFTGLTVGKRGGAIVAGVANVAIIGYVQATGAVFSYNAIVTFVGNQQARMVVNGKTFILDLSAGTSTPS